jgi:fermentation-respiration switch protein FrsA (DUF1100 family)
MINFFWFVLVSLLLLNGWMYMQQPAMIFFPFSEMKETPTGWGLEYEEVSLHTDDDVRLHGWYIPRSGATSTLLFFHGNAGNISHRGDTVKIFHRLGLNVLIIDYRGYGRSEGRPGEKGLYEDARAAWRYLTDDRGVAGHDIILFGRSLGGVVATRLASEVQPAGLIVESAFSSARDMANSIFPLLSRLMLVRFDFNAQAYIDKVRCPVLVAHSPEDEIIPFQQGQRIYHAAHEPKQFLIMRGDHNGGFLRSQPGYERQLQEYVASLPR